MLICNNTAVILVSGVQVKPRTKNAFLTFHGGFAYHAPYVDSALTKIACFSSAFLADTASEHD